MNTFAKVDVETFFRFAAAHPEQRYELDKGVIVQQMTGGTKRHGVVARRIARAFEDQVDPARWTVLQERGIGVGNSGRYADVVVEPTDEPNESLRTARPVVIVEVLSESTAANDQHTKCAEYLSIPSLDAYIIASQTEPAMHVWVRGRSGRFPKEPREITGHASEVEIAGRCGQLVLRLAEIYRGIG